VATQEQNGSATASPLDTVAASLGLRDVLLLRADPDERFTLVGGVGVGARWAGNVTVALASEPHLARAWADGTHRIDEGDAIRIAGPYFASTASIVRTGRDLCVLAAGEAGAAPLAADILLPIARGASGSIPEVSRAKQLDDELAIIAALRVVAEAHVADLHLALGTVTEHARTITGADAAMIVPVGGGDPTVAGHLGEPTAAVLRIVATVAGAGRTASWARETSGTDAETEPLPSARAYLAAPIGIEPRAVLYVSSSTGHGFTDLHRRLVEAVAAASEPLLIRAGRTSESLRIAEAFAAAAALHSTATPDDAGAVGELCATIARALGADAETEHRARLGGWLRDVGKLSIPDRVLDKPHGLDEAEWELVRSHPVVGAEIVARFPELAGAAETILHHHERYDGGGYPAGIAGDRIPLTARIVGVADAFAAITADRPYRPARSTTAALTELRAGAGTQFDPAVIDALGIALAID
jgi:hypothetical protein